MRSAPALLLLLSLACTPFEEREHAAPPPSPWLAASDIRLDVHDEAHQMTIEGRELRIDDDLDMQIEGDVTVEVKGDAPFSASAETLSVAGRIIELEGDVETIFKGLSAP